jgi:hypothetical protein
MSFATSWGPWIRDELDRKIDDIAIVGASFLLDEEPPVKSSLAGWQAVHKAMFGGV